MDYQIQRQTTCPTEDQRGIFELWYSCEWLRKKELCEYYPLWWSIRNLRVKKPIGIPKLCQVCRHFDLPRVLNNAFDWGDYWTTPPFEVPKATLARDVSCPLCCLLESITPPSWRDRKLEIQLLAGHPTCWDRFRWPPPYHRDPEDYDLHSALMLYPQDVDNQLATRSRNLIRLDESANSRYWLQTCGTIIPVRSPYEGSPAKRVYGRAIRNDRIDFALIRSWIGMCHRLHNHSVGLKDTFSPDVLIDCQDMRLVKGSLALEYVALHYARETLVRVTPDLLGDTRLSDDLPGLVKDAVIVVKELGYRYLFVEDYCMPPWMERKKPADPMIFWCASLVIIAAGGPDASKGLHGVSSLPRTEQPQAVVGDMTLVSTMCRFEILMWLSSWCSHKWEIGEESCSLRRLYFTEQQVHFQCDGMFYSETIDTSAVNKHEQLLPPAIQRHRRLSKGCYFVYPSPPRLHTASPSLTRLSWEFDDFARKPRWEDLPPSGERRPSKRAWVSGQTWTKEVEGWWSSEQFTETWPSSSNPDPP